LEATNFLSSDWHIATHDKQVLRWAYVPKSVAHGVLLEHVQRNASFHDAVADAVAVPVKRASLP